MPETSSVTDAAVDIASRLKRIEDGSNRLYHRDFLGLSWLAGYVADVDMVCTEVERLKAQVAAQSEVIEAARQRMESCERAWVELGAAPDDIALIDFTGEWAVLRDALARLDGLEHAQRNEAAVTQLQADMEAKA